MTCLAWRRARGSGNYNVFPGDVVSARSEDILNAVDAAIADGMDVLNLSLGGGYHGNNDLLAMGLDNAVAANVVVAVSAGNSGPGGNTIGSPGRARNIITAGASTNQHFIGEPFTYPATGGTTVGAAVGDFDPLPTASFSVFDTASDGCASVAAGAAGKLAITQPWDLHLQHEGAQRHCGPRHRRAPSSTTSRATRRPWPRTVSVAMTCRRSWSALQRAPRSAGRPRPLPRQ